LSTSSNGGAGVDPAAEASAFSKKWGQWESAEVGKGARRLLRTVLFTLTGTYPTESRCWVAFVYSVVFNSASCRVVVERHYAVAEFVFRARVLCRSLPPSLWEEVVSSCDAGNQGNEAKRPEDFWGHQCDWDNVDISWHYPSASELAFAGMENNFLHFISACVLPATFIGSFTCDL
jgi:hypothetical protein